MPALPPSRHRPLPSPGVAAAALGLAACLSLGPAEARPKPVTPVAARAASGLDWSPARATGPRDVFHAGDSVDAWATQAADAGPEWLRLTYAQPVEIAEIHVWQNDNPGAIARVTARVGAEDVELWTGADQSKGAAPRALVVKPAKAYRSDQITVHLDTARVSGWNEIDAVEVVATDGSRHWARAAEASTTYAVHAPVDRLAGYVGRRVSVRVDGLTLDGEVAAVDATYVTVRSAGQTHLVRRASIAVLSAPDR